MLNEAHDVSVSLIASDDESLAKKVSAVVLNNGLPCPPQCQVSLELAADRASRHAARLVILTLNPNPERALAALCEVTRAVQTHVLVIGPGGDPNLILKALHLHASEYLDEARLEDELSAAIVRFKARHVTQPQLRAPGRVIATMAPSGGSGASTIAVNIATVLARRHESSALLDLRLTAGDLASLLDLKPQHTLADLCERMPRVDRTMFENLLTRHSSGVHLLAAPRSLSQLEKVTTGGIRQAVALARGQFPYVVLDLDNSFGESQVETLWQADVIMLVLRLDYTSIRNCRKMMERLNEMGLGLERVQLVANRYGESKQLSLAEAQAALGQKIAHCVPDAPARINGAVNSGTPVVLQRSWARVSRSLGNLAYKVNGCAL